jgi:hypothetical protein
MEAPSAPQIRVDRSPATDEGRRGERLWRGQGFFGEDCLPRLGRDDPLPCLPRQSLANSKTIPPAVENRSCVRAGPQAIMEPAPRIVGVVRATEIRVASEVAGQLAIIKVAKAAQVHAGDEMGRNFWAEAVSNLCPLAFEPVPVGEREFHREKVWRGQRLPRHFWRHWADSWRQRVSLQRALGSARSGPHFASSTTITRGHCRPRFQVVTESREGWVSPPRHPLVRSGINHDHTRHPSNNRGRRHHRHAVGRLGTVSKATGSTVVPVAVR